MSQPLSFPLVAASFNVLCENRDEDDSDDSDADVVRLSKEEEATKKIRVIFFMTMNP